MRKTLFTLSVLALSSLGVSAQAATCGEMFIKAEKMVMEKPATAVAKKVKAYKMAVDSYTMCESAMAMQDGDKKTMMMKDVEKEFDKVYSFARDIE